ncbi:heme/hemin ABC transporter substrate-binding protein [Pseudoalteromonas shioyasakiensis]|uniref:heme/hemin ABC transporter substrate-binding protein n=1 Tax=Pseudoalteromonas shioyasakiensis TaxID=1190813 RepID=UPI002551E892|nr:ABC transporter substrate-binding protein [Pseudoalteromonas shioyasakiensis]MDK9683253.1 ABC transporter substrate-binding protein [Pseudoalteromonas shioyasakiensis]
MKLLTQRVVTLFLLLTSLSSQAHSTEAPNNIVVSGGSITEIIYALGEQARIVGVDSTSVYPIEARQKPQIGYVRRISAEGVLSLNPELVLGEVDTGPKKIVAQLQRAGLQVEILQNSQQFNQIEDKVMQIAKLLHVPDAGKALNTKIQTDRKALQHLLQHVKSKPNVLFVLSIRSGQPVVAGGNTSVNELIAAAGAQNIAASHFDGWKSLSTEAAMLLQPDIIFTMDHNNQHVLPEISQLAHFKHAKAVKNKRVYSFNAAYLLGMGPRTPQAVVELAKTFHPNAPLPTGYQFQFKRSATEKN